LSPPLSPLGELEEGDRLETDVSSNDQCCIFIESDDTFSKEHSFDEPYIVETSEVMPPVEVVGLIHVESFLDLTPTPSLHLFLLPSPFFKFLQTLPSVLLPSMRLLCLTVNV